MDITKLSIGGVYLVFLIIGTVQFIKEQGWVTSSTKLKLTAALVGIFYGGLYQASITWPGTVQWISMFIFVVATGLAATGLFDATKQLIASNKQ